MKPLLIKKIALIFIVGCSSMFTNAQSISVNATDYKQTIDMMGGDMERSSNAIQSAKNKEEIVDWAFKDIDFNVCRVRYDKNQELEEGTKNWDFYTKQIASMKMVQAVNPDIKFFASPRTDYDGYGNNSNLPGWFCDYDEKTIDAQKYGVFLADYVEYMSNQGLPIAYLSTMKEWATFVPANVVSAVIVKLNSELDAREIKKPLIVDQGFWSLSKGISYLNTITQLGTKDLYYAFCSHNYKNESETKWQAFINASTTMGKPAYNDETSGGYGGPTYGVEPEITIPLNAYAEKCAAYKSGLKGEVFFEIWSRGINKETRAIYFKWAGTGARMRGYYLMKRFANTTLGSKYISSSVEKMPDVFTMSFRSGNKVVLWVINKSKVAYSFLPVTVSNESISGLVEKTHWTATTTIEGSIEAPALQSYGFKTNIAAESLNCFVFNVGTTTSLSEVKENNVVLYPSLVKNGMVKISSEIQPVAIHVFDLNGRKMENFIFNKNEIDVSGLKSGMYMVRLAMANKQITQKIIIN